MNARRVPQSSPPPPPDLIVLEMTIEETQRTLSALCKTDLSWFSVTAGAAPWARRLARGEARDISAVIRVLTEALR